MHGMLLEYNMKNKILDSLTKKHYRLYRNVATWDKIRDVSTAIHKTKEH